MKKLLLIFSLPLIVFTLSACYEAAPGPTSETPFTDQTLLDLDYEGKSFLEDGIGAVTLTRCIDGDTARFSEDGGATDFSVRFLGIDTPEIGRNEEPWGRAASDFVCERLSNAFTIVLERNFEGPLRDTYGTRYLAFVWYDGRLINLELIELSYAPAVGAITLKYGEQMQTAWYEAVANRKRIHGEEDPNFDYDN
jgi:endonuclease YncB( thermonuclease family)